MMGKRRADMYRFSSRNLKCMRAFAAVGPDRSIVQGPLAQITWYHNLALLEKLDAPQAVVEAGMAEGNLVPLEHIEGHKL